MKSSRNEQDLSSLTCDPCRFAGRSSAAVRYCKDCHGHFCSHCSKDHLRAFSTRAHVMLEVERKTLPRGSGRIQAKCHDHETVLNSYCETHDALCCNVCLLTIHKDCGEKVIQLSEAAPDMHVVRMCKDLEATIKKMQMRFEEIKTERMDYIKSIEQRNEALTSAIELFRKSIIGTLTKLEDVVMHKKEELCKQRKDSVNVHVKTCQTAVKVLDEAYQQLDTSLKVSDVEMFVKTKRAQSIVQKYAEVLTRMQTPYEKELVRFIPDASIEKFLGGLNELGELKVETAATKREFSPSFASTLRDTNDNRKPNFIADVSVKMKNDKKPCYITGAAFLHDGRIVLADDSNKCVKLFSSEFKPLSSISLHSAPRDLTTLSQTDIATTLPNAKSVQILKVGHRDLERKESFVLNIECYGITSFDTDIYVTSGWSAEREIHVIKATGESRKTIKLAHGVFRYPLYIAIDPKSQTIYVSDYTNGIIALDLSGNIIMNCKDIDVGGYYKGVTLTIPGQVYACKWQQNGVSRVHVDGRGLEAVLTWTSKDRRKPLAIAYTSKKKRLVISFCGEKRDSLGIYKFY